MKPGGKLREFKEKIVWNMESVNFLVYFIFYYFLQTKPLKFYHKKKESATHSPIESRYRLFIRQINKQPASLYCECKI